MKQVYSVTSLLRYVKSCYEQDDNLHSILVKGEISNFTAHRSGHYYFSLKDGSCRINCVMFASNVRRLNIQLVEGMKVMVHASLSMYEANGSTQLYVTSVESDGIGDLFLKFEALKKQLQIEGLFNENHKKALPSYPIDIAVITAKEGAAIHDIMTTLNRRWPIAKVSLYPSLVQGEAAASSIMDRLLQADEQHHDLIVLARGGGSLEDLWCFNDEQLARLIYNLKTPIVTGVGHESDITLVDYVADKRFATPTAAIAHSVPDQNEVKNDLNHTKTILFRLISGRLLQAQTSLEVIKRNRYFMDSSLWINSEQMHLAMIEKQLYESIHRLKQKRLDLHGLSSRFAYLSNQHIQKQKQLLVMKEQLIIHQMQVTKKQANHSMNQQIDRLNAYNPLAILKRGYAVVSNDKHIVRSISEVEIGDLIQIQLQDGILYSKIVNQEES